MTMARIFAHLMVLIAFAGYFAMVNALTDIRTVGVHLIVVGLWLMAGAGLFVEGSSK